MPEVTDTSTQPVTPLVRHLLAREKAMQKLNATPLWKCGECGDVHEDEDEARECCMPRIWELWQCPECKKVHDE